MPSTGYFALGALFQNSPYADYNTHSRKIILQKAQEGLRKHSFYSATGDGSPGPKTQQAIIDFQKSNRLSVSGRLDSPTLAALDLKNFSELPEHTPKPKTSSALAAFVPATFAGTKKGPTTTIRLHCEGSTTDGPSLVTELQFTDGRKIPIRKVPAVNELDITGFYPFPGNDGLVAAYFRLDAHGAHKLQQLTVENKGRTAVVLVNGRPATLLKISGTVSDGILFVPGGLLPEEIVALQAKFPIW
jgi:hypothetical protein